MSSYINRTNFLTNPPLILGDESQFILDVDQGSFSSQQTDPPTVDTLLSSLLLNVNPVSSGRVKMVYSSVVYDN